MSRDYQCWLPESALRASGLDARIGEAVGVWSAKWLPGARWRTQGSLAAIEPPAAEVMVAAGDDLALAIAGGARTALAGALLDRDIAWDALTAEDAVLIEGLVRASIEDLAHRIAQVFRLPPDLRWQDIAPADLAMARPRGCAIAGEQRRAPLHLLVASDLMIEHARRAVLPAPRTVPLTAIDTALGRQAVALGARIGRCSLSFGEVAQLAIGDVLILDRAVAAPLELAIDGAPLGAGSGFVTHEEETFRLEILAPPIKA